MGAMPLLMSSRDASFCGISEKLKSEAKVTDSGVVGMDAAKAFFGTFKTLSEADAEWK